jgi:ComF family protein
VEVTMRALKHLFSACGRALVNALFPIRCVGCGAHGLWLCVSCNRDIPRLGSLRCFDCGVAQIDGRFCLSCRSVHALDGIWAVAPYRAPVVGEAIRVLKYAPAWALAQPLAAVLFSFTVAWPFLFSAEAIFVPVPLHPKKERERGFNQAHLLTAQVLRLRGGGTCGCWLLERTRMTDAQAQQSPEGRRSNVQAAFAARAFGAYVPARLILVDDVATTGATLDACASALRTAGAREVFALVLAKG